MSHQYPTFPSSVQNIVQNVALTTTSAASSAFGSQTRQIMLQNTTAVSTAIVYVVIGNSPTATTTTGTIIQPGIAYVFKTNPGETVAGITSASTASLNITELS